MTIHTFQPTRYYTTMGSHEPALHIAPGDTVITTTVDAAGRDADNEQVTPRGNPMTGPFFIDSAEPGDTLVVHLEKITPNRTQGWGSAMLAPNVVDPDYVPQLPWPPKGERSRSYWHVDVEAGTVTLEKPETRIGRFTMPIRPMIGCFGVAPAGGEAISTATSAAHGGNMDYRHFVEGKTVYFPVFVPGALFFLGDGHAVQGDGEMVGTGVEISCDVQFTVDVRKGQTIHWPRAEDDDYIYAAGNARPLDQAVQHATTELLRWLMDEYELDALGANTLMGQCVEYDLGNMFDPAYTMVCKMAKRWLK